MRTIAMALLRAGGGRRAVVVATATAAATAVLMSAACIALLWVDAAPTAFVSSGDDGYGYEASALNYIVDDPSTRIGVLFGAVLMTLPPLLLLDQAVRIGSAARSRRDAALRIAGATRSDVRRLAALEVALPSLVGGVLGIPVFLVLRAVLASGGYLGPHAFPRGWIVLLIIVSVGLMGLVVGARSASSDPLATSRRVDADTRLGWWGPACFAAGAVSFVAGQYVVGYDGDYYDAIFFASLALVALGIIGSAPWVAFAMARRAERRARTAAQLLAARRVLTQPGAAGRAAAGIGTIGLTLGAAAAFTADVVSMGSLTSDSYDEGLVATVVAALVALAVVVGSLVVHATESLWESRRELAFLAATGTPQRVLDDALLLQVRLVALPLGIGGAVLGAVGYTLLVQGLGPQVLVTLVGLVLASLAVLGASSAAVWIVRPAARSAARPVHLRTE